MISNRERFRAARKAANVGSSYRDFKTAVEADKAEGKHGTLSPRTQDIYGLNDDAYEGFDEMLNQYGGAIGRGTKRGGCGDISDTPETLAEVRKALTDTRASLAVLERREGIESKAYVALYNELLKLEGLKASLVEDEAELDECRAFKTKDVR